MTKMMLPVIVLLLIQTLTTAAADTCDNDSDNLVVSSQYEYQPTCSSSHITEALRSDVSCHPVPVVVSLPWPNVTDVQQMTPTHITVQR